MKISDSLSKRFFFPKRTFRRSVQEQQKKRPILTPSSFCEDAVATTTAVAVLAPGENNVSTYMQHKSTLSRD